MKPETTRYEVTLSADLTYAQYRLVMDLFRRQVLLQVVADTGTDLRVCQGSITRVTDTP